MTPRLPTGCLGRPLALGLCLVAAVGLRPAAAAAMRDLTDGWLLSAPDLEYCLQGPFVSNAPPDRAGGVWLGLGHTRIFSLPDLPQSVAAVAFRFRTGALPVALGVSWQQTGADFLQAATGEMILRAGGDLHLGVRLVFRTLDLEGRRVGRNLDKALLVGIPVDLGTDVRAAFELALGLPAASAARLAAVRRPLAKAKVVRPGGAVAASVDRKPTGEPVLSFEVQWAPVAGLAIGIRADPSTATLGPGIVWHRGSLMIRTSHLVHPELGATHRFLISTGQMAAGLW